MNLFHPDNPVIRFLSFLFDLILLNLLFVFSCIPIVTAGAALSAVYQVLFKIIDKKSPYILKGYLTAFKENFKPATLLWILIVIAGAGAEITLASIYSMEDQSFGLLQIPVFLLIFVIASIAVYAFPLLGRYQCGMKQLIKNIFVLSITHIPATVVIILFPAGILCIAYWLRLDIAMICCIAFVIGCVITLYPAACILLRIFQKYEDTAQG